MNELYYIPTNFTDAGRIMGLFEIRNLIEAVLLTMPILYLCIALLPLSLTPKIIVTLTIVVPIGGFGLLGVSDDSLTRWLGCWWRWRRGRRLIRSGGAQRGLCPVFYRQQLPEPPHRPQADPVPGQCHL